MAKLIVSDAAANDSATVTTGTTLRIGSSLRDWLAGQWAILFSHPEIDAIARCRSTITYRPQSGGSRALETCGLFVAFVVGFAFALEPLSDLAECRGLGSGGSSNRSARRRT